MGKSDIKEIQKFWSNNPMTYGKGKCNSPEDICNHAAENIRAKAWFSQEQGRPFFSNLIDFDSLKGKRVLEIGHGVGWLAREFIKAGALYTGIDLSTYHHELCKNLFSGLRNAEFILGDAETLPFEDNRFDYIVSYGVMHHSANTTRCIREAHRVLKKKGTLFLMLYRRSFIKYWHNKFFKFGILRGELLKYRSPQRVVERHTDTHGEGSGPPISRHYTSSDLPGLLSLFTSYKYQIFGSYQELRGFPSTKFNIARFLSLKTQQKILKKFGGYLNIWAVK